MRYVYKLHEHDGLHFSSEKKATAWMKRHHSVLRIDPIHVSAEWIFYFCKGFEKPYVLEKIEVR